MGIMWALSTITGVIMPSFAISNELEELSRLFRYWSKNNTHKHYPQSLWQRAIELLVKYDLKDVAKSTGYPPSYLRRKMKRHSSSLQTLSEPQFVEVQVQQTEKSDSSISSDREIRVMLKQSEGKTAELSFQGKVSEAFPLLFELFRG